MGHHKLEHFAENLTFSNLFQISFETLQQEKFALRGKWHEHFGNSNPITLELGCGKGDYTIALAQQHSSRNFIGIDIKGARLWRGAKTATEEQMHNVAFIRTRIELIESFFGANEIDEIWITFPDPQPKKPMKRLTSERFLNHYRHILKPSGFIHLKTDSQELYDYTLNEIIPAGGHRVQTCTDDLYHSNHEGEAKLTQTFYEKKFLAEGKPITYIKFILNGGNTSMGQ